MKYKIILVIFFLILNCFSVLAEEIFFNSGDIKILQNGNLITAKNGKAEIPDDNIEIEGERSIYNKLISEITVTGNVKFFDGEKDIYLEGEKLIYNKLTNIVRSIGKTYIRVEDTYEINSVDLVYDRNLLKIFSNKETVLEDDKLNVFNLEDGFKFDIKKEIISSKRMNIIDVDNNNYFFEKARINLIENEIVGKEVKVDFIDSFFGNENNDPLLKGKSTISNDDETKIYKAVFSTCNVENKKCRGWEMETDEFRHDKIEKNFEYKDSWLKIFGKKFIYFPFFSHPDPTVKRRSGFLTPIYGNSGNLGYFVDIPYFKAFSEAKDMTIKPRLFTDQNIILQSEYREAFKSSLLTSDFSIQKESGKTNTHLFANLDGELSKSTNYKFQFQNVSNDNYLKKYNLSTTSPIITNESLLKNNVIVDKKFDDRTSLNTSFIIYEDLSKNDSDRYQYILPNFNFVKNLEIDESYNGNFKFISSGFQKNYETNKKEIIINNDFLFESYNYLTSFGLVSDYDVLLKSFNSYAENSSNYDEKNDHEVYGQFMLSTKLPLKKTNLKNTSLLTPIISARYSPNDTKNISNNGTIVNYDNIFNLNRIGNSEMVEGGKSLTLGLEYEIQNENYEKVFSIELANVLRDKENLNLPSKSKIGKTRSDIIGKLSYSPNNILDFNYQFSYDRDFDYSNYDAFQSKISLGNFITEFNYITENHDLGNLEVINNKTSYQFNENSSIGFTTNKDLKADFTEYYNLIYDYETDCLNASVQYNKTFYRNGDLVPDESIQFVIKFIPFAEVRSTVDNIQDLKK